MRNVTSWIFKFARCRLLRPVVVLGLALLLICAYGYSAVIADFGDGIVAPAIAQEALRAFIAVQIGKALWERWWEFTPSQRLWWVLVAAGVLLNLGRGHFSGTPLTLSFFLLHLGLMGLTWRLMAATRREVRLKRECKQATADAQAWQQEALRLQGEIERVGTQSKHFEQLYYATEEGGKARERF